jgi:arylsulfatase
MRTVAALLLAALAPPAWAALRGGADLDLPAGLRVSWYQALGPTLAAAAALLVTLLGRPSSAWRRGLLALGLVPVATVAWVAWAGPLRTALLRVGDLGPPGALGLGCTALALLAPQRSRGAARLAPLPALLALSAGLGLGWGAGQISHQARVARLRAAPLPPAPLPDVILIIVDTLRADALGAFGATPSPSPFLDAWMERALLWERAMATAPWTFPSMASLMTGRLPASLDPTERGAFHGHAEPLPRIAPDAPRLARELARAGYFSAGFQKNPYLAPGSGLETGFDLYEMVGGDRAEKHTGAQITDAALRFAAALAEARRRGATAPVFLYLHYMDPHLDYRPPRRFLSEASRAGLAVFDGSARSLRRLGREGASEAQLAQARHLYRDDVRYVDAQIGRLAAGLGRAGLWSERSLVVLTADHGEAFGEHGGLSHPHDLHAESLHVPLAIAGPGLAPRRIAELASGVDLVPTLLALLGLPPLAGAEGRDLLGGAAARPALSHFGPADRATGARFSLLRDAAGTRLYDRDRDPGESRDVSAEHPAVVATLAAALDDRAAGTSRAASLPSVERHDARVLDPETRAALEALGYLDAPSPAAPGSAAGEGPDAGEAAPLLREIVPTPRFRSPLPPWPAEGVIRVASRADAESWFEAESAEKLLGAVDLAAEDLVVVMWLKRQRRALEHRALAGAGGPEIELSVTAPGEGEEVMDVRCFAVAKGTPVRLRGARP